MKIRFTILIIAFYLLSYRYPHVLNIIKLEAYSGYYLRRTTDQLDVKSIIDKLNTLADDESILSDSSLNLNKTAFRLSINPQQLSEILNNVVKKTFSEWINEKRIEMATRLLVSAPDQKILEIALGTGFNSISSFNTAFKRQTGLSPSAYRKQYRG